MVVVVAASQRKQSPSKDKANVAGVWATVYTYQHTIVEGIYKHFFDMMHTCTCTKLVIVHMYIHVIFINYNKKVKKKENIHTIRCGSYTGEDLP